jgi:DNA-binding NtrC family response regulator
MNILLLAEAPENYFFLKKFLSSRQFHLFASKKSKDVFPLIRKKEIKIVIIDSSRNDIADFALLKRIKDFDPLLDIIIVGPGASITKMAESIREGAADYLVKPLKTDMLQPVLEKIQKKSSLRQETFELEKGLAGKYIFQGMTGKNPQILEVFSLIERIARHSVPVLVTGETGTGKEMVAQAVHKLSLRQNKRLVICDCSAIPETLFESELFGYLKGAFTGADKSKDGLFKEADGGTIFLDEIGEIPVSIQSKLLRVLEDHQFRPLASNRNVNVNVRVISSSSRDLRDIIKRGNFREDLFHRINVIEIYLPPLRERKEDIPLLCSHFLKKYNQKFGKKVKGISQRARKDILKYFWPGNVRQLENMIERAVMLCRDDFIDIKDLPDYLLDVVGKEEVSEGFYPFSLLTLEEVEKRHILEVLKRADYNKSKAAKLLKLSRKALYRKLKKHGISQS